MIICNYFKSNLKTIAETKFSLYDPFTILTIIQFSMFIL
jgi:hypothetical protein